MLIIRGITDKEIPPLKQGLDEKEKKEFALQVRNTKTFCKPDSGFNMNSTSPLCVHGDYSGAQPTHNTNPNPNPNPSLKHALALTLALTPNPSTYNCPCAEGSRGNVSYGSGISVICNFAEESHLTLYAKDSGVAGANYHGKMVDIELGAGDIVLFDHGVIHGEH